MTVATRTVQPSSAGFSLPLVVAWDLTQFGTSMGELTSATIPAVSHLAPITAHFRLVQRVIFSFAHHMAWWGIVIGKNMLIS